jgi:tRNA (adenine37-N6)-methyltransferase
MQIVLQPVAFFGRMEIPRGQWDRIISTIELADHLPTEALMGISEFLHLEIIYCFDQSNGIHSGTIDYSLPGIFAQRRRAGPNKLGMTIVELMEYRERTIKVKLGHPIDGTTILDIKPVMNQQTKPKDRGTDLLENYWKF